LQYLGKVAEQMRFSWRALTTRHIHVRRSLGGALVLLLIVTAACKDGPTAPSDSRPAMPTVGRAATTFASADAGLACTIGAGYWKAHTDAWPSRFDPAAAFYSSGTSWIDVLRTPPEGDIYDILGHQFSAAALNLYLLDPALRPDEVGSPFAIAGGSFTAGAHTHLTRTELVQLAMVLERFNEGNAGVPACR
jgi:hypothetical protein